MFWFIIHDILTLDWQKAKGNSFFNQLDVIQNILKTTMCLKFREDFWVVTISKTSTFEENFLRVFLLFVPLGSARGLPWAVAPEAEHRCTTQPTKATIPWSSGSSRRRRPWMHRTEMAVASEEDLVGKPHETWDSVVRKWRKMLMVHWWFNLFLVDTDSVFTIFWKACQNICTNVWCCCLWTQLYCSESRNRVSCPSQFKLFLRLRSVHSDIVYTVIKHCLTGSLFAVSQIRGTYVFFQLIYELGLISNSVVSQSHAHICFLRDGTFFQSFRKAFWLPTWFTWPFSTNSMSSKHPQNHIVH